ncbi:PaaX family transcriptional regulator C-terminal domain-containing protein [Rhodococcus sp. LB1]
MIAWGLRCPTKPLLPPGWNGVTAGRLFNELNGALNGPAREHAMRVIHQP